MDFCAHAGETGGSGWRAGCAIGWAAEETPVEEEGAIVEVLVGGIVGTAVVLLVGEAGTTDEEILTADSPPRVRVGVTSSPSAEEADRELPLLPANAAAVAPPISAETMMNFFLEDFFSTTLLCGISTLDTESL